MPARISVCLVARCLAASPLWAESPSAATDALQDRPHQVEFRDAFARRLLLVSRGETDLTRLADYEMTDR